MSIRLETERIKNAKASLKTVIDSKLETPIPESATLDQYPTYVEQLAAAGDGDQINEQLSSQVTGLKSIQTPSGQIRLMWDEPDDPTYSGLDLAYAKEATPSFPLNEDQVISIPKGVTEYVFTDLEPNTIYGFMALAKNNNGMRTTSLSTDNVILGYPRDTTKSYLEVPLPEEWLADVQAGTIYLSFATVPELNFILCGTSSSSYPGLYVLDGEEWLKINTTLYMYECKCIPVYKSSEVLIKTTRSSTGYVLSYNTVTKTCKETSMSTKDYWGGYYTRTRDDYIFIEIGACFGYYDPAISDFIIVKNQNSDIRIGGTYEKPLYEDENVVVTGFTNYQGSYSEYNSAYCWYKGTTTFVKLASIGSRYDTNLIWKSFISSSGNVFIYVPGYSIYLFNQNNATASSLNVTATSGTRFVEYNDLLFFGALVFNNTTKVFENVLTKFNIEGLTSVTYVGYFKAKGKLYMICKLDINEYQCICKYNTTTGYFEQLYVMHNSVNINPDVYGTIDVVGDRAFIQLRNSDWSSTEITVFNVDIDDWVSYAIEPNACMLVDNKGNAFLTYKCKSYVDYQGFITDISSILPSSKISDTSTTPETFCQRFIMQNDEMLFALKSSNNSYGIYKFDKYTNEFKTVNISKIGNYDTHFVVDGVDYILRKGNNTAAVYKYDSELDTLLPTDYISGYLMHTNSNKTFNTTANSLTSYNENNIQVYNNLTGTYTFYSSNNIGYGYGLDNTNGLLLVALN